MVASWSVISLSVVSSTGIRDQNKYAAASLPLSATVLGFGAVGTQVAEELKKAGYDVHVYDPDPTRQAQATALGMTVHADKTTALTHANLLVSATGRTAVSLDDVKALPKQAILVNAASAPAAIRGLGP